MQDCIGAKLGVSRDAVRCSEGGLGLEGVACGVVVGGIDGCAEVEVEFVEVLVGTQAVLVGPGTVEIDPKVHDGRHDYQHTNSEQCKNNNDSICGFFFPPSRLRRV